MIIFNNLIHFYFRIIESGLRFFDKIYVLKVLSLLMSYNIQITENIAIEIQNNPKAFVQLSNHEIYLYIEALKDSGTDFHAISQILYQAYFFFFKYK